MKFRLGVKNGRFLIDLHILMRRKTAQTSFAPIKQLANGVELISEEWLSVGD